VEAGDSSSLAIPGRNAVIVAPAASTGVAADRYVRAPGRAARARAAGAGQGFIHESIIGSRFEAEIAIETPVGRRSGIVPTIAGQAWITGVFQHGLDPSDPFRGSYTLPDLWFA
jgi:proline racemase